jgi:cyanophycinase
MELGQARAKLMAIGGAEDKENDQVILKEFVRLAKGPRARIVVMTIATDSPKEVGDEYAATFKKQGVDDVQIIDVSTRADTEAARALQALEQATGVFFTGGDQLHITSFLGGSKMHRLLIQKATKGAVIAGTSAGASMMGNSMIIGGEPDTNPRYGAVDIGPGMDFFLGAMVDVHFSQRGRMGRLISAVAHFPQDLGIGIDEDTAIIATDHHFKVIGAGAVTVIDAGGITYTNLPDSRKDDSLSLYGLRIHVLSAGHQFDLAARMPVEHKRRSNGKKKEDGAARKSNKGYRSKPSHATAGKPQ